MAKKSNKTAHVLNLISSPKQSNNENENIENEEKNENLSPEKNLENEKNQYSTLQTSLERTAKTEEISNKIKDNLIKELEENNINKDNVLDKDSNKKIIDENLTEKKDFYFYNICEELIKEKVVEYLERFSVCTCKRCIADTIALTLTNLVPKYVVTDKKDCVPFLSYYDSKFSNNVMTELTKACLTVLSNPRHKE